MSRTEVRSLRSPPIAPVMELADALARISHSQRRITDTLCLNEIPLTRRFAPPSPRKRGEGQREGGPSPRSRGEGARRADEGL